MVNNVNGSNPNLYVDPRSNNNGQQKFVTPPNQQGGYRTDGYAFNMSNNVATGNGPVPDVKVGFMDRMGLTFKDVMASDENTKRYVAFQNAMKSNPQGYLQPNSNDVTATTDLQKKLKMMGYNITVNGSFGNATEQAVIKFKNSVGVNDGYLTKSGNYAVSGIVTPQTWAVLNASVAARMNPNSNVTGGLYTPPVTQTELNWAKELQSKISNFGYRPSQQERTKYEDIYQRQRVGMQTQGGAFDPRTVSPPTEQEMSWAKDLANKMKQFGYKPSQVEKTKYQEIYQRIQMNKNVQTEQPKQLSQAEVDWAVNLMNKVKNGYQPTNAESQKYEQIYTALQNGQGPQKKNEVTTPTPVKPKNDAPPTQAELKWASDLESKVAKGYNPTTQEKEKYTAIFEKYKAGKTTSTDAPKTTGKPSQAEVQWAADLEKRVNEQGYQPSQAEIDKYTDIANRLNASQKDETKPVNNTTPTEQPTEVEDKPSAVHSYTIEIFGKIGNAFNSWKSRHPETPFPREHVFYPKANGQLVSQIQVNNASKAGGDYISKLGLKNANAIFIPDISSGEASNFKYINGSLIQNKGGSQQTQPTKPAKSTPKPQSEPDYSTQNTQNTNSAQNQGGVTQQELDWANNLQQKASQGYTPTQQEMAAYTDIYNRMQGTQQNDAPSTQQTNQNVNIDVSNGDQELQWALNMLDKVQQGYQPSQDEITKYEQIIAKNQSVPATP